VIGGAKVWIGGAKGGKTEESWIAVPTKNLHSGPGELGFMEIGGL
jgi:hypothetical protein